MVSVRDIFLSWRLGGWKMEIKDAIRQRRQERMRKIQEQTGMAGNKAARAIHLDSGRWKGTNGEPEINSTVPAVHTAGSSIAGKKEAARETREEANLPPNAKSGGSLDPEHMWKHKGGNWRDWEEMPRLQGAPSAPGGRPPEYTGPDFSVFRKELFVKLVLSIMHLPGCGACFIWTGRGRLRDSVSCGMPLRRI